MRNSEHLKTAQGRYDAGPVPRRAETTQGRNSAGPKRRGNGMRADSGLLDTARGVRRKIGETFVVLTLATASAGAQTTMMHVIKPTLIRNATIMTVTQGTLQNGDLLIERGKIAQIGKNLTAPTDATIVDGTGKFVMPGIIDPHSHSMIDAVNEGTLSVTSMVNMIDVLNPTSPAIYRELAGGTTTINVLHGSANTIGGQTVT